MRGSDLKRFKLAGSQAGKLAGCLAGKQERQDCFLPLMSADEHR